MTLISNQTAETVRNSSVSKRKTISFAGELIHVELSGEFFFLPVISILITGKISLEYPFHFDLAAVVLSLVKPSLNIYSGMYESLQLEKLNKTLLITINRPKVMNALKSSLLVELKEVIANLQTDDEVLGAIITGAGDKAFAAGADISELSALTSDGATVTSQYGQDVFFDIENSSKPIIAAVNGYALGGGCELAMACHFRIASMNARFGQPEVDLGLLAGYGGTQRLPLLIGKGRATELLLTGAMISADEAYRMGLVNYLTTREELIEKCQEILRKIYTKSPLAVSLTLKAIQDGFEGKKGYATERELFGKAITSEDGKEGTAAFLEKRKPNFTGK